MNFADRFAEDARKTVGTDEKRITAAEFDTAVAQVMEKMMNDERIEGMAKFLVPLTGSMFAADMRKILFGEEK